MIKRIRLSHLSVPFIVIGFLAGRLFVVTEERNELRVMVVDVPALEEKCAQIEVDAHMFNTCMTLGFECTALARSAYDEVDQAYDKLERCQDMVEAALRP